MKLTQVRGEDCPDGRTCPAVHVSDSRTVLIIGSQVTDPAVLAGLRVGEGESVIEVPLALLPEVEPK